MEHLADARPHDAARSVWIGTSRPTPAEMRTAAYDLPAARPADRTLVICAAPRTSSKRLARLLLAGGVGVPMEYFNPNCFKVLIPRWGIPARDYLETLRRRRAASGVLAVNLQHHQLAAWPADDMDLLFRGACVVHLVREDTAGQVASLAACHLTGQWGFDAPPSSPRFSDRELQRAARAAARFIGTEAAEWARFFTARGAPRVVTAAQVNRIAAEDLGVVAGIASEVGVDLDRARLLRMIDLDHGPYPVDTALKARLLPFVQELIAGADVRRRP